MDSFRISLERYIDDLGLMFGLIMTGFGLCGKNMSLIGGGVILIFMTLVIFQEEDP